MIVIDTFTHIGTANLMPAVYVQYLIYTYSIIKLNYINIIIYETTVVRTKLNIMPYCHLNCYKHKYKKFLDVLKK